MTGSRIKNTTRNIKTGILYRMVSILLPFINRTVILKTLGAEFTGLSGLFSSILEVLNIAELGFNSAIVYSLYRPMAENNEKEICEIVFHFKKIYDVIGILVFGMGLMCMPFIKYLVRGAYPNSINIYLLFLLYLVNASVSYFLFAYKECLLIADQRQDIANAIRTTVVIVRYFIQFLVLILIKSFYIYLIVSILGTILTNLLIQYTTFKKYPFCHKIKTKREISSDVLQRVKGLTVGKICDVSRNSFDSLIISSGIGLVATTIYGNYYYIYSSLYGIMLVICNAMSASVGNSIIKKNTEQNYHDMLLFSFIFAWIMGWCTVCLVCLYQPFMELWVGKELMLPSLDMFLFCIYFYVINMNNIRNQYISGTGLWWCLKRSFILETGMNLILNFILCKFLGITGVLLATIITILLFNYIQRNIILFQMYFKDKNPWYYMREQMLYALVMFVAVIVTYFICDHILCTGVMTIVLRGVVCIIIPNFIYASCFIFSPRFNEAKKFVLKLFKIKLNRI